MRKSKYNQLWIERFESFIQNVGHVDMRAGDIKPTQFPRTIGWPSKRRVARYDVTDSGIVYHPGYAIREGAD